MHPQTYLLVVVVLVLSACGTPNSTDSTPTSVQATQTSSSSNDLYEAIESANQGAVKRLLDNGASANGVAGKPPPLLVAAVKGDVAISRLLLEKGARANAPNAFGVTALIYASQRNHIDLAQLLIDHKANVNHSAKNGVTPLIAAAIQGNKESIKLLINNGADINRRDQRENTAFSSACFVGNADLAIFLYEKGADITVPEKQVEVNGRLHHIMGDYFLAKKVNKKSQSHFRKAKLYYDKTAAAYSANISKIQSDQVGEMIGEVLAGALLGAAQSYQSNIEARQFAQIGALKHAQRSGTGVQGYNRYMKTFNQSYVPTYSSRTFAPIPSPGVGASADDRRAYTEVKINRYQKLSKQLGKVLECFENDSSQQEERTCVKNVATA